jgi:OOP family OmpA-OmpF porin
MVVSIAKECFGYKILIVGYTDSTASELYNKNLSKQRALSVATTLLNCGINKSRIVTKWYGETKPIAPNNTKDGRYKNRRVEIKFIADQGPADILEEENFFDRFEM